jgi:hypothetical protein
MLTRRVRAGKQKQQTRAGVVPSHINKKNNASKIRPFIVYFDRLVVEMKG